MIGRDLPVMASYATVLWLTFLFALSRFPSCEPCNLVGNWYDSRSVPDEQLLFRIQQLTTGTLGAVAVTYNPQWGTGTVNYDQAKASVTLHLDDGEVLMGSVSSDCSNITWTTVRATWIKAPQVQQVHVVFMNHLDVGYAGFVSDIINEYFNKYFPRAVKLAEELSIWRKDETFIYTTHPWLVSLYLDCPPNLVINDITVNCPSQEDVQAFDEAIRKGTIAWHAGPMNMQIEFMNKAVLEAGLTIAQNLNKKYNRSTSVLSQRDVPGMTVCALDTFSQYGIKAVSVGVNSGSAPPAVPKIFIWKGNNSQVIALWHAGGYPDDPGRDIESPKGISYRDCTVAPGTTHALCFAFRTDNTGPPTSLEEMDRYYEILSEEFPEATVFASTLDDFVAVVDASALPVISSQEIGDTWIQGIASDPRKSAEYRALSQGLSQCMRDGACDLSDSVVANATRFLVKLTEHTWGLSGIGDYANWTNHNFSRARSNPEFVRNERSWIEQRAFINLTLEACQGHKLHDYLTTSLQQLPVASPPDLSHYTKVDPKKIYTLFNGKVSIGFDTAEGTVNHLIYNISEKTQFTYATSYRPLGEFTYISYNDTDFAFMASRYDYYFNAGYNKPMCQYEANPESRVWPAQLQALYQSKSDESSFLTHLTLYNMTAHSYYGAPAEIWVSIQPSLLDSTGSAPSVLRLDFDLTLIDKTTTRLPEATMFSFFPSPPSSSTDWVATLTKVDDSSFKVGEVIKNGSQYQHVVEQVLLSPSKNKLRNKESRLSEQDYINIVINSTDIPLMCPITGNGRSPTPFPVPLETLDSDNVIGIAFNIHNNIWNTNYPLYYPFAPGDENFRARFTVMYQ